MPDFFDQICAVISENERRRPGSVAACREVEEFFADIKKSAPAAETVEPVTENQEITYHAEPVISTPAPAIVSAPVQAAVPTPAPTPVPAAADAAIGKASMAELDALIKNCRKCQLCQSRTNTVFGEGNPDAQLMFIGEGPGFDEDRLGRPFVGKAGQLLDKMIRAMQFTREEVYIANIVKCRPPDNRVPTPDEAAFCLHYLERQIELIRPSVIVLLGATAVKYLLGTGSGISKMRGRWLSYHNIPVMPTFHPAFLLRQESAKRDAWNDLQQVMARFNKFHSRA